MILKDGWLELQEAAQTSVVQVVAQVARFNWLEPYKVFEQGEQRGSGFFIDDQGHIITNAHVVHDAIKVLIHLPILGRRSIFADVVSICPERDFALLRIKEEDFAFLQQLPEKIKPLPLGDSDKIQRTERVLILGYPLGQHSLKSSTGVISGRESDAGRSLIQITAPINPGNSGGPLLNSNDEVIGIAISMVFLAQSVGYAIPINELRLVLEDLFTKRFVRRETLGATFNYASDEMATYLGNPLPAGLYINHVLEDSLLDKVGIAAGDMIYEINGLRFDSFGETAAPWNHDKIAIYELVARLQVGQPLDLVVYRAGQRIDVHFTFDQTPPTPIRYKYFGYDAIEYEIIAGMVIMQLADNHLPLLLQSYPYLVNYLRPENKLTPVLVITHIIPGSVAQQSHALRAGFIVAQVNGIDVTTMDEFRNAVLKSIENNYLTVKTSDTIFTVFSFEQVLHDELLLSKNFAYPLSVFMRTLLNIVQPQ